MYEIHSIVEITLRFFMLNSLYCIVEFASVNLMLYFLDIASANIMFYLGD